MRRTVAQSTALARVQCVCSLPPPLPPLFRCSARDMKVTGVPLSPPMVLGLEGFAPAFIGRSPQLLYPSWRAGSAGSARGYLVRGPLIIIICKDGDGLPRAVTLGQH